MVSERSFVVILMFLSLIVTLQAQTPDNLCENKFSGIIPYPGRCDKYVLCVLWSPIEILCPEDEFFDKEVLQCVKGDRVLCQRATTPNPTPTPTTSTSTTSTTTTTAPPTLNEICFGVFFSPRPYPGDDHLFVGCIRGRGTVFQCEENELFIGNECVEVYTTTVSTTTPSTTTRPTTTTTTTTMRSTTTTEVPVIKNICDGINNGLVKHPSKDCSLYIQCYQQSETVYQCKIGEIFSLEQQKCAPGDDETCELFPENTITATAPTQMTTTESSSISESSTTTTEVVTTQEPTTTTQEPTTTTDAPAITTTEESTTTTTTEEPTTEEPTTTEAPAITTTEVTTSEPATTTTEANTTTTTEGLTTTTQEPTTTATTITTTEEQTSTTQEPTATTEEPITTTTEEPTTTTEAPASTTTQEPTTTTTVEPTTSEPATSTTTEAPASTTTTTDEPTTTTTTIEEVFQNPCDGIVYDQLPHPTKCYMFIQCVMSKFQMVRCPEYKIYDIVAKMCVTGEQETCKTI